MNKKLALQCPYCFPLVGYRVHDTQLQQSAPVRTFCRTERFYLAVEAKNLGFLENPQDYRRVIERSKQHILWAWERPDLSAEEHAICETAMQNQMNEIARLD